MTYRSKVLGKKILEIAEGHGITHEPHTTQDDKCIADFEAGAGEWVADLIEKLLDWLYDNHYMRPQNVAGTLNFDAITEQFLKDEDIR